MQPDLLRHGIPRFGQLLLANAGPGHEVLAGQVKYAGEPKANGCLDEAAHRVGFGSVAFIDLRFHRSSLAQAVAHEPMRDWKPLALRPGSASRLPTDCARSMEGEVFEVYEIDEWGGAWVEKWWRAADGTSSSHSLGLGPNQMEVVLD